jgi:hypothetical protein
MSIPKRSSPRPPAVNPRTSARSTSTHVVRAAYVPFAKQQVIVVEVGDSLVSDMFEAQLLLSAIELTCAQPAVLWASAPCGCRELYGRREHIQHIDALAPQELEWKRVVIDFAHPKLPMLPIPSNGGD